MPSRNAPEPGEGGSLTLPLTDPVRKNRLEMTEKIFSFS
ncbi:hypothetical protein HNR46_004095 [Haloferula luteola]|uniref:Uncharacterized protein n=1 Tax=Haloferula luteola TaxID=595692 RepID=A0A840VMH7_9BACT|nr:hypothetical protein [Haloferula luteola]